MMIYWGQVEFPKYLFMFMTQPLPFWNMTEHIEQIVRQEKSNTDFLGGDFNWVLCSPLLEEMIKCV